MSTARNRSLFECLAEWYEWNQELARMGGAIVAFFLLFAWAAASEGNRKDRACDRMWAASRTSADTVAVIAKCDLGPDVRTVTVPVYIQH